MKGGPEFNIVETPVINYLEGMGYTWLKPSENITSRDGLNQVILRDIFISSIIRINNISQEDARLVYLDLLNLKDNEQWTHTLRGNYSRTIQGETKKKTIHLIDFLDTKNNVFTVSNQYKVEAEHSRIPDLVCFINGIPVVVIEAKSPVSSKNKMSVKPSSRSINMNTIFKDCSIPMPSTLLPMESMSYTVQQVLPLITGENGKILGELI